jgi:hypothetical protein
VEGSVEIFFWRLAGSNYQEAYLKRRHLSKGVFRELLSEGSTKLSLLKNFGFLFCFSYFEWNW